MKKTRLLTKLGAAAAALFLIAGGAFSVSAASWSSISGTSKWLALPGNDQNGTLKKTGVKIDGSGLTVTYTGGEYSPGGNNAGVMFAQPVDIGNFSVEFTVLKKAGNYTAGGGVDSWISLCLLNKPDKYFNVNKAGESQGIVTLIRPMEGKTSFEINQLTNSFANAARRAYPSEGDMLRTFSVQIKKNASGIYDYIINGEKVDFTLDGGSEFTSAFTTLMEKGNVYFYMGVSCKTYTEQIEWRITKINGQAVKADAAASTGGTSSQPASVTSSKASGTPSSPGASSAAGSTGAVSGTTGSEPAGSEPGGESGAAESETNAASGGSESAAASRIQASSQETKPAGGGNIGPGAIAGIAAGAVVVLGGAAAAILILRKKKTR